MLTKKCTKCGEEKELVEFSKDKNRIDGFCPQCKVCTKLYKQIYYIENKDKVKEKLKLAYQKRRGTSPARKLGTYTAEVIRKYKHEWYIKNKDKIAISSMNAYQKQKNDPTFKQKHVEYAKEYRGNNLDIRREHEQRRRAKKKGVVIEKFTNEEIYERDGYICNICDAPIDRTLKHPDPMSVSLDHVVPLDKGGSHTRDNVHTTHLHCNLRKGVKSLELVREQMKPEQLCA